MTLWTGQYFDGSLKTWTVPQSFFKSSSNSRRNSQISHVPIILIDQITLKTVPKFSYVGYEIPSNTVINIKVDCRLSKVNRAFFLYSGNIWMIYCLHIQFFKWFYQRCLQTIIHFSWSDFNTINKVTAKMTSIEATLLKIHFAGKVTLPEWKTIACKWLDFLKRRRKAISSELRN